MLSCSSGKCQISHWRQGHKDECCPTVTATTKVEDGNIASRALVSEPQFDFHGNVFN
jgi:ubiquitin carboxyl-terminal hydrolase 36/42